MPGISAPLGRRDASQPLQVHLSLGGLPIWAPIRAPVPRAMLTRDAARHDSGIELVTSDDEGGRIATRAVRALRGGRKDEAQTLVRRVLAIAPDDPEALYTASEVTWALDDASGTELIVERAIAHEKERAPAGW